MLKNLEKNNALPDGPNVENFTGAGGAFVLDGDRIVLGTDICSEAKWNDGLHGSDIDRCKAEIILINFPLYNNF